MYIGINPRKDYMNKKMTLLLASVLLIVGTVIDMLYYNPPAELVATIGLIIIVAEKRFGVFHRLEKEFMDNDQ